MASILIVSGILLVTATLIFSAGTGLSAPEEKKEVHERVRASSLRVQCPKTHQLAGIDVVVHDGSVPRLTVIRCERFGNALPRCMQDCIRPKAVASVGS